MTLSENVVKIQKFSLFRNYFGYFDTKKHIAHKLFLKYHLLNVKVVDEYESSSTDYVFIICSVPKIKSKKFITCMNEMFDEMYYWQHKYDYSDFCQNFINDMENNI